jgi:glutamine amidotransferase
MLLGECLLYVRATDNNGRDDFIANMLESRRTIMCRFVAYLGMTSVVLDELIRKPVNSLVNQSKGARDARTPLNADGFGIGWYDHNTGDLPGIYKSVQPAWNDFNLKNMLQKLSATCFVSHVRDATMGSVSKFNCHPFFYKNLLFAHNGTIRGFDKMKRKMQEMLSDEAFDMIKGHTDSEHFFALLHDFLPQNVSSFQLSDLSVAVLKALAALTTMRQKLDLSNYTSMNCVFTDGCRLIATRYSSDSGKRPPSLYYSLRMADGSAAIDASAQGVIVSSEPLTDLVSAWHEVPENHMVLIDADLTLQLQSIDA